MKWKSQFSSVTQSHPTLCNPMDYNTPGLPVHHQLPKCTQNSCPLSQWCHPTISSSVVPFSSCLQSFPASGSFPMSQLFGSGGQNIGASASASVPPMNVQDWFPLGLTDLILLQSKGLPRVFSNTIVWRYQFSAQPTLWSNSQIHTWLLEKPSVAPLKSFNTKASQESKPRIFSTLLVSSYSSPVLVQPSSIPLPATVHVFQPQTNCQTQWTWSSSCATS